MVGSDQFCKPGLFQKEALSRQYLSDFQSLAIIFSPIFLDLLT